jgi:hypothetical protein
VRASGIRFSQQISPPMRPISVGADPQARAVALAPDEPLAAGRLQLAVQVQQLAFRIEQRQRAVERAGYAGVALDYADGEKDRQLARRLRQAQRVGRGGGDGGVGVAAEEGAALGGAVADGGAEGQPARIAGNERLREEDELRAMGGRLSRQGDHLLQRRLAVEHDGGVLDNGDLEGRFRAGRHGASLVRYRLSAIGRG